MSREVEISQVQYQQFWQNLACILPPRTHIMAVVKANGYGLGAERMARLASQTGSVSYLGVATAEEGAQLRLAALMLPILVFSQPEPTQIFLILTHGLEQVVYDARFISHLNEQARLHDCVVPVHLKIDTGMGRLGCLPSDVFAILDLIEASTHLKLVGVCTHFSCADEPENPQTMLQFKLFLSLTEHLDSSIVRHCANSAAVRYFSDTALDMVRVGIDSYTPTIRLKSRVQSIRLAVQGSPISYGGTYVASQDTTIVTVEMGYADGIPRGFSGHVLIRGQRFPVVGRVCMDLLMVDVGSEHVEVGDEVVFIGSQHEAKIDIDEFCVHSGRISYEVLCGLGPRVVRQLV